MRGKICFSAFFSKVCLCSSRSEVSSSGYLVLSELKPHPGMGSVRTQDIVRRLKECFPTSAPKRREDGFIFPTRELILEEDFPTLCQLSLACSEF
jgi:hypothetical protein